MLVAAVWGSFLVTDDSSVDVALDLRVANSAKYASFKSYEKDFS